jgi:isoquinoline 1-oxidoreductase beta subunit
MIEIIVNGETHTVSVDPDTPLLWVLRDVLGLKGTKFGCGVGICGICMILIDGESNHACMVPLEKARGRNVTTIEGLAQEGHPLLSAWLQEEVPQCGYCQPGQIMAAAGLLNRHPNPGNADLETAMSKVLCRCGTYQRIRRAIARAVDLVEARDQTMLPAPLAPPPDAGVALSPWLRIHGDNTVTMTINFAEMGQGASTALAMLISEELEADWAQVRMTFAPAAKVYVNPRFGVQVTGGSTAVSSQWEQLRRAGASARIMLIRAAARQWRARVGDCRAEACTVIHDRSGRRLQYAALADRASKLPAPKRVTFKPKDQWRLLGQPAARLDLVDMVQGKTAYGFDIHQPDMLVASVQRSPVLGGRVKSVAADDTLAVPGVRAVHVIDSGVAVLADDAYTAMRGRRVLRVEWSEGLSTLNSTMHYQQLQHAAQQPGKLIHRRGSVKRALAEAHIHVSAGYRTVYLAHATLEPMNCIAHVHGQQCDVWVGTQNQSAVQKTAAGLTGLPRRMVNVHSLFCGGGFGRRLETDMVTDAVQLAQKVQQPVQVVWTRQDDLQHDVYRPANYIALDAALDVDGQPTAWRLRAAGPSLALDMISVPYAVLNFREEHRVIESEVPIGNWRSVGAGQNAFAIESFIDELAYAAGQDPCAYRHRLLRHAPRYQTVLELAAEKAGWGRKPAANCGHGIAIYRSFGTIVAQVAEVTVLDTKIVVQRVVCAIDCGTTVNPGTVRAQMEGGIAFGLSAALHEEINIEAGRVLHANLEDYPILTLGEMPAVEVHIVPSTETPGGVGEPGVPPIAPAVANAVYAATGQRLRSLPLRLGQPVSHLI